VKSWNLRLGREACEKDLSDKTQLEEGKERKLLHSFLAKK